MLGLAPVVDFDGTVATLLVPWSELRRELGVARIDELWDRADADWTAVTDAEVRAARDATAIEATRRALLVTRACAILTSNSESAVRAFLDRQPELRRLVITVVGRETLRGPKTAFDVFRHGYEQCVAATASWRGDEPVVYVGDQDYETAFATRLGAHAISVAQLREVQA